MSSATIDVPDKLEHIFTYHSPRPEQVGRYQDLRDTALLFARCIERNTPPGPDRTAAIRKVREAVMTANASIALDGVSY